MVLTASRNVGMMRSARDSERDITTTAPKAQAMRTIRMTTEKKKLRKSERCSPQIYEILL